MTRIKAASTHFLISATLSAIVISLLLFGWYPLPYFWALGGPMLLTLIIGIDMVLGPLMTLIVFNPQKTRRALLLDLSLIAIVQVAALGYGLYAGYGTRVVFNVFDGARFQLVQAGEIAPDFLKATKLVEYKSLPMAGQRFAYAKPPEDLAGRNELAYFYALNIDPYLMPHYYVPLQQGRDQLSKAAIPQSKLLTNHPNIASAIDKLLREQNLEWRDIAVVPFRVKTANYTTIVRLDPVEVLKILAIDPR